MARITVEDCLARVPNRFSLVLVAAERTKQLVKGADLLVDNQDHNKEVVIALREIAANRFVVDDSAVNDDDTWKPEHRQKRTEVADPELPQEF